MYHLSHILSKLGFYNSFELMELLSIDLRAAQVR